MSQPNQPPAGQPRYAPVEPGSTPKTSTLAWVALGIGVVGTIFGLVKGALIVGWILLPIAFVVSIIALVQKRTKKTIPVVALVVSIVGSIIAAVFFVATAAKIVGDAVDEASGGKVTVGAQPSGAQPSGAQPSGAQPSGGQQPADDKAGTTRENPLPLNTPISNDNWKVVVNSFTPDATKQVLASNEFNDKPEAGSVYALANVTLTYTGADKGSAMEVGVDFVTASGNVVTLADSLAVAPKPLDITTELYKGASATGDIVLQIPQGDAGVLRVTPGLLADPIYFATK